MGAEAENIYYAMTLSFEKSDRRSPDGSFAQSFSMNTWLVPTASDHIHTTGHNPLVVTPPVDVRIGREEITLLADMPGIPKENIDIRVLPRYIEIIGTPREADGPDGLDDHDGMHPGNVRAMRHSGDPVTGGARARLSNGVLELRLPRQVLLSGRGVPKIPVN